MVPVLLDREVVSAQIERNGPITSVEEFLETLVQSVRATKGLTAEARQFFLSTGTNPELLEQDNIDNARIAIVAAVESNRQEVLASALNTGEVAELLGTAPSNVRRSIGAGDIYSYGVDANGSHRIPRWQFVGHSRLPHLREIVTCLPTDLHPLEIEAFFTASYEQLRGSTPAHWLATGGPMQTVLELATEIAHQ